jgi:hypothetical protein
MIQKEKFIALLIILFARTAFIFGDMFFSSMQVKHASANLHQDIVASDDKEFKAITQTTKINKTIVDNLEQ